MKHGPKIILGLAFVAVAIVVVVVAFNHLGPAGGGFVATVLALFGIGGIPDRPKVPGDSPALSQARERNREAGAAAKESVGELKRGSIELEATVGRIEGHHTNIRNTANNLGSLADQIRRGVAEGTKQSGSGAGPGETGKKP